MLIAAMTSGPTCRATVGPDVTAAISIDIWSSLSRDGGKSFSVSLRVSHALSPSPIPGRNAGLFGDDIQHLAMDDTSMHLVWGDSRAGFQAVWYGRVPIDRKSVV